MWYAAHALMVVRFKDRQQKEVPVWENILLIRAENVGEAYKRAEERARLDEGDSDGTFEWSGNPARWEFKGIRRVVECALPGDDVSLGSGAEITYLEYSLSTEMELDSLCRGEDVNIKLSN